MSAFRPSPVYQYAHKERPAERARIGLRADGTLLLAGASREELAEAEDWQELAAVSLGWGHLIGLRADGTLAAAGENHESQCRVEDWDGIRLP